MQTFIIERVNNRINIRYVRNLAHLAVILWDRSSLIIDPSSINLSPLKLLINHTNSMAKIKVAYIGTTNLTYIECKSPAATKRLSEYINTLPIDFYNILSSDNNAIEYLFKYANFESLKDIQLFKKRFLHYCNTFIKYKYL